MREKIRIAIITKNKKIYSWQHSIMTELKESYFSEIILNINFDKEIIDEQEKNEKATLFWKLYLKIDNYLFRPKQNALLKKEYKELLNNVSFFKVNKDFKSKLLKNYKIDIIINFTDIEPSQSLINTSEHGIWFLNHCDMSKINKRPYGIWEILNKMPETVATLRYIKKDMAFPKTIDQTSTCTDRLSHKRNLNDVLWQSCSLIINNIKLLSENENLYYKKIKSKEEIFPNSNMTIPFIPPSNRRILSHVIILYSNKIIQLLNSLFYFHQWIIVFYHNKNNSDPYSLKNYKRLVPPKDRFWADPLLIKNNNKYYVFIEELIFKNKLGHLSVMEIDKEGNYSVPKKILEKKYHLSYPFVFKENDTFYMIPETSGNNDIQLYKCTEFPLKWELEKILMKNVIAVDTTIHKINDTYWMFTNIKKQKGASKHVELFLFSSKNLITDKWKEHPLNPIINDVKKARPAGSLFISNNKLFRPSQNCSNYYGYGLNMSVITQLSQTRYEEKTVHSIIPNWDIDVNSTHTFNSIDNLFIADIKIKRKRFS